MIAKTDLSLLERGSSARPPDVARDVPVLRRVQDRRDARSRDALLQRVRAEFEEMPCMRLTLAQAQRLFGLRADICSRVLETLVEAGELTREADGRYVRDAGSA